MTVSNLYISFAVCPWGGVIGCFIIPAIVLTGVACCLPEWGGCGIPVDPLRLNHRRVASLPLTTDQTTNHRPPTTAWLGTCIFYGLCRFRHAIVICFYVAKLPQYLSKKLVSKGDGSWWILWALWLLEKVLRNFRGWGGLEWHCRTTCTCTCTCTCIIMY